MGEAGGSSRSSGDAGGGSNACSEASGGNNSGDNSSGRSSPDVIDDPGLLDDEERTRRLFQWSLENPEMDPRHRFGAFDWSQIETILEEPSMSEARAARHLQRLRAQGCGGLGLTLRTRDDASSKARSLLDDNPANLFSPQSETAGGSLHFFEETIHHWNGQHHDASEQVPCTLVMRELVAVALAAFLDPHAYGRQRTRHHAPTTASGERIYAHTTTGEFFRRAEANVGDDKQLVSFDMFYDETVIESNGKRYKPFVLVNNHLPVAEKKKKSNWWLVALVEITTYATTELGRTQAAKRSRADKHRAVLARLKRELYGSVGTAGRAVVDINRDPAILVPTWQGTRLDKPEQLASAKVPHCARCETASKEQLAEHPPSRPARDAEATRELVENALAAAEARRVALQGNDADERRRTRRRLARYKRRLKRHGVHLLANSFFGICRTPTLREVVRPCRRRRKCSFINSCS